MAYNSVLGKYDSNFGKSLALHVAVKVGNNAALRNLLGNGTWIEDARDSRAPSVHDTVPTLVDISKWFLEASNTPAERSPVDGWSYAHEGEQKFKYFIQANKALDQSTGSPAMTNLAPYWLLCCLKSPGMYLREGTSPDAISLTKQLGRHYLRVDALCVVQNDYQQKEAAIDSMEQIYCNSTLTTTAAVDTTTVPDTRLFHFRTSKGPESRVVTAGPGNILDTRGWILQEQILSARVLIYTAQGEAHWICNGTEASSSHHSGRKEDPNPRYQGLPSLIEREMTSLLVSRAVLSLMLKGGGKTIIITTGVRAVVVGPTLSAYQPSKLAVVRLVEFIAKEYRDDRVVTSSIHPGNIPADIIGGPETVPEECKEHLHIPHYFRVASKNTAFALVPGSFSPISFFEKVVPLLTSKGYEAHPTPLLSAWEPPDGPATF
ncbi:hypothetical protein B0O99DRAFT_687840 [Bisporella sp. PMI_857]|nr:hypothetical protein B0O99DRAFT_687840 [Bisporella sp. PMI_857]